jgi:signal transduction histidine kinase
MDSKKSDRAIIHGELNTILRSGALINSSLNIEDVLDHTMAWAEEFMDAEASTVYELDQEKKELYVRLARGEKKESIERIKVRLGEGIAGWVVKTGQPVVVPDVGKHKRFTGKYDKMTGFRTRSMICVPLILRDKPIGALQVLNKRSKEAFTQADLKLLTAMGQQIAVALENATLYQRLERQLELTARELTSTQQRLIRSERLLAMGHLVQGVAHEIRNPITTIGGFAHRIKRELKDDRKLQKYIDIILDESSRLEKLVTQVREFAQVQSADLDSDDIRKVVDEVMGRFQPLAERQGVRVIIDVDRDTPLIQMDSPQMVTALSNIVENALESMPKGGTMALKVTQAKGHVLINVRDTGCGIPKEQLESIYDPFVTSKTRGAGLGLTMVHQIITNHHGEIKIRAQQGKGTLVTIRLPVMEN